MKKHTTSLTVPLAIFMALALVYLAPSAFSQDDMTMVPAAAFGKLERAQVPFEHDLHNEKAEIDDCGACHHGRTDDGKMDMENTTEGESCESCHPVDAGGDEVPLMRAYHRQCAQCHAESLKGPVACGQCHRK